MEYYEYVVGGKFVVAAENEEEADKIAEKYDPPAELVPMGEIDESKVNKSKIITAKNWEEKMRSGK